MKKTYSAAVMICFIAAIFTGCTRTNLVTPTQTIAQKLIGTWTMSTATTDSTIPNSGNFKDTTNFTSADNFTFNADSTVDIMATGVAHNGRWKIVNNKLVFTGTNYVDIPATGWELATLTSHKLELNYVETEGVAVTDFKLDFIK